MLYMITGGSGSGKSEYAEHIAVSMHQSRYRDGALYYVATMYPYDEECHARIRRHQNMRKDKGFQTLECYTHLEKVKAGKRDVILLECMSNLLANEMYQEEGSVRDRAEAGGAQVKSAIIDSLLWLEKQAGCLIVVTNEIFSAGVSEEKETADYIRYLGKINTSLARSADAVVEVVCSIPIFQKGGFSC